MDSKSQLPQNQDQKKFVQDDEGWGEKGFEQGGGQGSSESNYKPRQENISNRGYEEDQPHHPVRGTGSTRADQDTDDHDSNDKVY